MAAHTKRYTLCAIAEAGQSGYNPRGAWAEGSEAELLTEGFSANLTALRALQQRARLTPAEAADALCVSVRTYRRWLQHGNPSPTGHIDHGNYGIQDLAQRVVVAR